MTNTDHGYFVINRKLCKSWLYPAMENRKFTKYEAWIWLIENAKFQCSDKILLNNKLIIVPRGYLIVTIENLSEIFKWNSRTTEKFLKLLEEDNKIARYKINPKLRKSYTFIKIKNYNTYQPQITDICTSSYRKKCRLNCAGKQKNQENIEQNINNKEIIKMEDDNFFMELSL